MKSDFRNCETKADRFTEYPNIDSDVQYKLYKKIYFVYRGHTYITCTYKQVCTHIIYDVRIELLITQKLHLL